MKSDVYINNDVNSVVLYATTISTIFINYVSLSISSMFILPLTGNFGQFYLPVLIKY